MNSLLLINKVFNKLTGSDLKLSFAQCGEDRILLFLIQSLNLDQVQYFDIGTNHPKNLNNTYLLYINNFKGICVEPDPAFHTKIKHGRPRDVLVPAGISVCNETAADFYIMDEPLLNTFSAEEADRLVEKFHRKVLKKTAVDLISINTLFEQYYEQGKHNILCLDVEGLDLAIILSVDFNKFKPSIICVENVEFSEDLSGKKDVSINNHLVSNGYVLYADTFINSIFVRTDLFKHRIMK